MVKFYADKIRTVAVNQTTGEAWTVENVPKPWREKVVQELEK